MIHPWITALGGRRFLLTCWCTNALIALCAFDKISGGEVITGLGITAATYIGGNVSQKIFEGRKNESVSERAQD